MLLAPLVSLALAGCASTNAPALRDSHGWPIPTYALTDGMSCYDPVHGTVWSARQLRFRDGTPVRGNDLICRMGRWDQLGSSRNVVDITAVPPELAPSRPPVDETVAQPVLDTVR